VINALWAAASREKRNTVRLATLKYGAFNLRCDLQEDLQRQFYFFGTYFVEEHILSCWERAAKSANVIFDVGANLGIYSFAALAAQPNASVHAFEPTSEIASQLREAAALNNLGKLNVHEVAVSSTNGYAKLNRCRGEMGTNGGMNYIFGHAEAGDSDRVPTVRLDDFCDECGIDRVDLLKIDVQGHEYEVFVGAERLLRAGRIGLIFFELNWFKDSSGNCPTREAIRLLEHYGYQFSEAGRKLKWKESGRWMNDLSDVLARMGSERASYA
jgi:FkbM family methyltransferase